MKNYIETIQEFNQKIIDAMRIPNRLIIDDPIKAQPSDFKYGMTDEGGIVALPSSSKIIWKFLSYPPESLSTNILNILKSDDPIAPHRGDAFIIDQSGAVSQINLEMTRESFLQEYQCDFKQNYEISHYDDLSADIKSCIDLSEFGLDLDRKGRTYYVDCAVIFFRNGTPRVSYYANMNDFTSHPKFKADNLIVCLHEQYRRSETKLNLTSYQFSLY